MNKIYIVREVEPDCTTFEGYFDNDGIKSDADWRQTEPQKAFYTIKSADGKEERRERVKSPYNYNLFIIKEERYNRSHGFNYNEYKELVKAFEQCAEELADFGTGRQYYTSPGAILVDCGLITNIRSGKKVKALKELFASEDGATIENIAQMLSIVRGEKWAVLGVSGYCQGDYVEVLYCEHSNDGTTDIKTARAHGEVWLGCAKEFVTIDIDENGEEADTCGGYIIADSQAWTDEDYKKLVCEWADIPVEQTELQMIDGQKTYTKYNYRTV